MNTSTETKSSSNHRGVAYELELVERVLVNYFTDAEGVTEDCAEVGILQAKASRLKLALAASEAAALEAEFAEGAAMFAIKTALAAEAV